MAIIAYFVWLMGLAILLGAASVTAGAQIETNKAWPVTWRTFTSSNGAFCGAVLFCLGVGLSSGGWIERCGWVLLTLYISFRWWRTRRAANAHAIECAEFQQKPEQEANAAKPGSAFQVRIAKYARWVAEREPILLLFVAPLLVVPGRHDALVLALMVILWGVRWFPRSRPAPGTPFNLAILLLAIAALASTFAGVYISGSASEASGLLLGIALFYSLVEWMSKPQRLTMLSKIYVASGVAVAIIGLLGTQWNAKLPFLGAAAGQIHNWIPAVPDLQDRLNPNLIAGSLAWTVPFDLAMVCRAWSVRRVESNRRRVGWLVLASAVTVTVLLLTQSRSAIIGLFAAGVCLAWFSPFQAKRAAALLVCGLVVSAVTVSILQVDGKVRTTFGSDIARAASLATLGARVEIWQRALYDIEDFPLLSAGIDSFQRVIRAAYPVPRPESDEYIPHAHNQFLQVAVDLGLAGLVAYMSLWTVLAMLIKRLYSALSQPGDRWLLTGVAASSVDYFVYALTDTVPLSNPLGLYFWGILAMVTILWKCNQTSSDSPGPGKQQETAIDSAHQRAEVLTRALG